METYRDSISSWLSANSRSCASLTYCNIYTDFVLYVCQYFCRIIIFTFVIYQNNKEKISNVSMT